MFDRQPSSAKTAHTASQKASNPKSSPKARWLATLALLVLVALASTGCFRFTYSIGVLNSEEAETKLSASLDPASFPFGDQLEGLRLGTNGALLESLSARRSEYVNHENAAELLEYLDNISLSFDAYIEEDGWIGMELSASSPVATPEDLRGIEAQIFDDATNFAVRDFFSFQNSAVLEETGSGWSFSLDFAGEILEDLVDLPETLKDLGALAELVEDRRSAGGDSFDDPELFFSVTLPGNLKTTTAEDVVTADGFTTATWQVFPLANLTPYLAEGIVLETSTGNDDFPIWLIFVLAGVAVVLLGVLTPRKFIRKLFKGGSEKPHGETIILTADQEAIETVAADDKKPETEAVKAAIADAEAEAEANTSETNSEKPEATGAG